MVVIRKACGLRLLENEPSAKRFPRSKDPDDLRPYRAGLLPRRLRSEARLQEQHPGPVLFGGRDQGPQMHGRAGLDDVWPEREHLLRAGKGGREL